MQPSDRPRDAATEKLRGKLRTIRSRLEGAFSHETAMPGSQCEQPSASGHCAATAIVVQEEMGGELVSTVHAKQSHWFNRFTDEYGQEVDADITGDQFGGPRVQVGRADSLYPLPAKRRTITDVEQETLKRAELLARRAGLYEVAEALRQRIESTAA